MKLALTTALFVAFALLTACGGGAKATSTNPTGTKPTTASGSASETVKQIYDHAIKRNCSAIPPMLTEDFKKAVGTSKDALDALCDSFTDSGKLTAIDVASEDAKGDAATVKVNQTFKDGKKESKTNG